MNEWINGTQYHLDCDECKLNIPHTVDQHIDSITERQVKEIAYNIVIKELKHKTTFNNPTYHAIIAESRESVRAEVVAEFKNRTK